MLCSERDSLRLEHQIAFGIYCGAIRALVVLVDHSAEDRDFKLAHLRINAARGASELARATREHHEAEHGC
jgi:hypothetical protein